MPKTAESKKRLEDVKFWVPQCLSHAEVARKIGSTTSVVWEIINRNKIDYSHFKKINKGHKSRYAYKGKDFGRLHVEFVFTKKGQWKDLFYCNCSCWCGKKDVIKYLDELIQGLHYCCGCSKKNRLVLVGDEKDIFSEPFGELNDKRFKEIKRIARDSERVFSISKEYIWSLYLKQNRRCNLSGIPISFGTKAKSDPLTTASLDRIDSNKDYVEGNVQWVHKDIQRMKMDLEEEYFTFLCGEIWKKQQTCQTNVA